MKIIFTFETLLIFMGLFLLSQNISSQNQSENPFNLQEVNDKRFSEIKDSLYKTSGGFRDNSSVYFDLNESDLQEIRNSLKNGIIPYLNNKRPYMIYEQIYFGPVDDALTLNMTILNIKDIPELDFYYNVKEVNFICGNLNFDPQVIKDRADLYEQYAREAEQEKRKYADTCDFYWLKDTILKNSDFVRYSRRPTILNIEWGNEMFTRTFPQEYYCSDFGTGIPVFDWSSNNFIGLRIGCGTQCWGNFLLPMNEIDSVEFIWYPITFDKETNTLVYIDSLEKDLLVVHNLNSGNRQLVYLDGHCPDDDAGNCLEKVLLKNGELIVEYNKFLNLPDLIVGIANNY